METLRKLQREVNPMVQCSSKSCLWTDFLLVVSQLLPNHSPSYRDHQREENKL